MELTTFGTALISPAMSKKAIKINVMLTPEEAKALEDVLHAERRRSMSGLARDLLREALTARGMTVDATAA